MKFIRMGICALIAFGVLAHGGVEEWAIAVFEIGAGLLFVFWAVLAFLNKEERLIISPLLPPLVAFSLLVFAQYIFHGTASAYNTRIELALLIADVIILFLAAQAFRTADDWRGFVWFIMIFGFLVSVFGILQHLTFNGKLYWFRELRLGGIPFGPYVNRNHFAGFAELVIPVALVPLVLGKVRQDRWFIVGLFAVLPIVALFLSASRGGIVSLGMELAVIALWLVFRRTSGTQMIAGGAVLMVALLLVSWLGVSKILQRFSGMQSLEATSGKRASMRLDTWRIFLDHPLVGTGLGTLQVVFPRYETLYDGKIVNHTHNDYLEALAETGIIGGLCCAWFLWVLLGDSLRRLRSMKQSFVATLHFSGLVACIGFLVHSLVDFNLHIPANALLFFLMAHLAAGTIEQTPRLRDPANYDSS
ncbi:MAG TPA: O-antigen ligase family protein [Candidatus Dormibacteraeota bacterium]|nr:O-antigen ligase family protein [Candidatus Dormibacteraeota bacterium]